MYSPRIHTLVKSTRVLARRRMFIRAALALAMILATNGFAFAGFAVYKLDQANAALNGAGFADGGDYGTVTVYDSTGSNEAGLSSGQLEIVLAAPTTDSTYKKLGFSLAGTPTLSDISITASNNGSSVNWSALQAGTSNMSEFGGVEYTTKATTGNQAADLISIVFTTTGPATIDQFKVLSNGATPVYFVAHWLPGSGSNTGYVGGTTLHAPAPSSALLALSALVVFGLVSFCRLRQRSQPLLVA